MKINFDRMAKLAGLEISRSQPTSRHLNESQRPTDPQARESKIPSQDLEEEEDKFETLDEVPEPPSKMEMMGLEEMEGVEEMYGGMEESEHDHMKEMDADPMDEMIEVDEVMLVQELRRAKSIMNESRKRSERQRIQEARLQKIVEEEIKNIFGDLNLNSDWVYGKNKPQRSKQGYTHQGAYLKGIGFK